MSKTTVTEYHCDLCGKPCEENSGRIEIQVNSGDGRDVGPGFLYLQSRVELPYRVANGKDVCIPCLRVGYWLPRTEPKPEPEGAR